MPAFLGTLGTCFMVLATPYQADRAPLVITGFADIKLALEVRDDIWWGNDAASRNRDAEYQASPAYQEQIAREAKEQAEHNAKCAKNSKALGCPDGPATIASMIAMSGTSRVQPWSFVQVIAAPESDCRK